MNKKEYYILSGLLVFIFVVSLVSYYFDQKNTRIAACTLEARICPDGSAVGRIPPNCEFAPCPAGNGLLGGDRDEHGCIPSAGYSWCEVKQKCLRTWEEACEAQAPPIGSFEDCVRAGYPVMESYPRQCAVPEGGTFVEDITEAPPVLDGDRDEHGCIPSAGYSWCEAKQKCLRTWEEACQ